MGDPEIGRPGWGASARLLAGRLFAMGANRLDLLTLEIGEERDRLFRAALLGLGIAGFGLLAGASLTALVLVVFWDYSPAGVLALVTAFHVGAGLWLYRRLRSLLRDWVTLPASFDQLRKDRACLERMIK